MFSPHIQKLIEIFSKFPTVGPRTAARFVFYLIKKDDKEIDNLISSILDLKKNVKICKMCFNLFELDEQNKEICEICSNPKRDRSLLCVVEKETDLISIEKIKKYQGLYFVLGGVVKAVKGKETKNLRIKELRERVKKDSKIKEIILAINPTTRGEITSFFLERFLKPYNKKITRLARGLPQGGELEYADEDTLNNALKNRK